MKIISGAKPLTVEEQRAIVGGRGCNPSIDCCGICTCGLSNTYAYPGQYCGVCCYTDPITHQTNCDFYYAGPGCV